MKEDRFVLIFISSVFLLLFTLSLTLSGTGDSGDSVMHFLFAKYAFQTPANFYDSWAKPLYVFLASPFAQLGFTGIKIFNSINTIVSMVATYLVVKRLKLNTAWLAPVLLLLAPMNFALSQSGLTEPLFASLLISGLCFLFYEQIVVGLIILSFLPFVRSEGMFLLIIVAIYLIQQKKLISIAWLFTGQIIYSIAGYFHFGSLLWFYQHNPYSVISQYGHGAFNTYFINMPLIAGPASCFLLAIGFLSIPFDTIKKGINNNSQLLLVWALFTSYFFFHVISWAMGLFGSFGMPRIINGVAPVMIIICVNGFNSTIDLVMKIKKDSIKLVLYSATLVISINLTYMVVRYCNHINSAGFDLTLSTDELVECKMVDYIKHKYTDYTKRRIYYHVPYLSIPFDINPTDPNKNPIYFSIKERITSGSLYIWDDWYSVTERNIKFTDLINCNNLVYDTSFVMKNHSGKERKVALFKVK